MPETKDFPWTHDQYQRYAILMGFLEVFYSRKKVRLLDVGGLSPDRLGKKQWLPIKKIWRGSSYVLDKIFSPHQDFIQGEGTQLPFKDNSFDVVSALDVLEHIPRDKRELFLQELGRIAKDSIMVSFPFKNRSIKNIDDLLFRQIKKLYRAEHLQLLEHKDFGLPGVKKTGEALKSMTKSGAGLYYGSLKNWLLLQSVKNCFLFKEGSAEINSILDRFFLTNAAKSEIRSPYSRHFWFFSKKISQARLNQGMGVLRRKTRAMKIPQISLRELMVFNDLITRLVYPETVSAVIVSSGNAGNLEVCLRHVLTQRVEFNLDVSVWDLSHNPEIKQQVEISFPGVRYITIDPKCTLKDAFFRIALILRGQYFLFVTEDVSLPSISVQTFYDRLRDAGGYSLLTPKVIDRNGQKQVGFWETRPEKKILRGQDLRAHGISAASDSPAIHWMWSEVLFFKREGLFERSWTLRALSRENIFLWGCEKNALPVHDLNGFVVSKIRGQ